MIRVLRSLKCISRWQAYWDTNNPNSGIRRHLLYNIQEMDLEIQKKILDEPLEKWMLNEPQTENILILGIEI